MKMDKHLNDLYHNAADAKENTSSFLSVHAVVVHLQLFIKVFRTNKNIWSLKDSQSMTQDRFKKSLPSGFIDPHQRTEPILLITPLNVKFGLSS